MTDLLRVLPHFPLEQYGALVPALERHQVTTTDLLTLDAADLGKRTHLPLLDIRRLSDAVVRALQADLGVLAPPRPAAAAAAATVATNTPSLPTKPPPPQPQPPQQTTPSLRSSPSQLSSSWSTITTLDAELDRALGGGVPVGYLTEVAGESGAGKTQLLLSLLLAVQLPPPHGLGRPAMYVSTEAPLATRRLAQMLASNPMLRSGGGSTSSSPPSLDRVLSIATPDLESQDHILTFQVPVEAARRNVGLIVIDSVAANFRAEFERGGAAGAPARAGTNMAARGAELVRLGAQLRELARTQNLAVVVANQVADRFFGGGGDVGMAAMAHPPSTPRYASSAKKPGIARLTQQSPLASRMRSLPPPPSSSSSAAPSSQPSSSLPPSSSMREMWPRPQEPRPEARGGTAGLSHEIPALLLDHQQRWFTGWGDEEDWHAKSDGGAPHVGDPKTPSLGLVWSTQVAARIVLIKRPVLLGQEQIIDYEEHDNKGGGGGGGGGDAMTAAATAVGGTTNRLRTWRRWMKVVFASHAPESGPGLDGAVEFDISSAGLRGLPHPKGRARTGKRKREAEG